MAEFNVSDVTIPLPEGKKAIGLSGGLDSALLCYLLMREIGTDEEITLITFLIPNQSGLQKTATENILALISAKLNDNISYTHELIDVDANTNLAKWNALKEKMESSSIDYFYRATTTLADENVFGDINFFEEDSRLERTDIEMNCEGYNLISPFINIDKAKLKELYTENNLNDIVEHAVSCISATDLFPTPCGKCYWCKEREWAGF